MDTDGLSPTFEFLLYPIAVSLIGSLVLNLVKVTWIYKRERRRQIVLVAGLIDEIAAIRRENGKQRADFVSAQQTGLFKSRVTEDPRYHPHAAIASSTHVVFDPNRNDFSFLRSRCFNSLVDGYDEFALLHAQMQDWRTPEFRELPIDRKLKALDKLAIQFSTVEKTMSKAARILRVERKRLQPFWLEAKVLRIRNRE